jgi:hypothetical protein
MAFDFLGTFDLVQLEELETFLTKKLKELDSQTNHLIMQAKRIRALQIKYEQALKQLGATQSNNVLIVRALEKKEVSLGKFVDNLVERKVFEQVLLKKPSYAPEGLDDITRSILAAKLKKPFIPEIKFQRERLENKIRKCGDLAEQLEEQRMVKLISREETANLIKALKEIAAAESSEKKSIDISSNV